MSESVNEYKLTVTLEIWIALKEPHIWSHLVHSIVLPQKYKIKLLAQGSIDVDIVEYARRLTGKGITKIQCLEAEEMTQG